VNGQHHTLTALFPDNNPGTHWTGGWVGPTASLDVLEKRNSLPPASIQTTNHPVCSLVSILITISGLHLHIVM